MSSKSLSHCSSPSDYWSDENKTALKGDIKDNKKKIRTPWNPWQTRRGSLPDISSQVGYIKIIKNVKNCYEIERSLETPRTFLERISAGRLCSGEDRTVLVRRHFGVLPCPFTLCLQRMGLASRLVGHLTSEQFDLFLSTLLRPGYLSNYRNAMSL